MANNIQKGNEPEWLHLGSDEEVLWDGRQTAYSLVGGGLFGLLLLAAGIVGTAFLVTVDFPDSIPSMVGFAPLVLSLFAVMYLLLMYLRWKLTYYVVTTSELYHRRGIFSQNVQHMRIYRIQNTTCNQSFLERVLSFGDITIYTAGSGDHDFILENVPSPQQVNRRLTKQLEEMEAMSAGSTFEESSEEDR